MKIKISTENDCLKNRVGSQFDCYFFFSDRSKDLK